LRWSSWDFFLASEWFRFMVMIRSSDSFDGSAPLILWMWAYLSASTATPKSSSDFSPDPGVEYHLAMGSTRFSGTLDSMYDRIFSGSLGDASRSLLALGSTATAWRRPGPKEESVLFLSYPS
jgi:hypothetical protein